MDLFTSDLHLGHSRMLLGFRGKKFNTIEEHDQEIIANLIDATNPGDNLYILGDIFWKYTREKIDEFFTGFKKHRVNIHWIDGNHDRINGYKHKALVYRGQIKDLTIEKQPLTLCHYPMYTWNRSHYGAWQLFGHHHSDTYGHAQIKQFEESGKRLDVCCEFFDYKPISFEQIKEIMDTRPDNWDLIRKDKRGKFNGTN